MEWRAKKHDLPPKLFDGMRASYPGVREGEVRRRRGGKCGHPVVEVLTALSTDVCSPYYTRLCHSFGTFLEHSMHVCI